MFLQYSNYGETQLNVQWTLEDALAKQYDPTTIMYNQYIYGFQKNAMKYMRLHPGKMSNEDLLSLLRKNLQWLHDCLDIQLDSILLNETHWLHAFKFISNEISIVIRNEISPAHVPYAMNTMNNQPALVNQALKQPPPGH